MWISVSKFVIFWTHCRLLGFSIGIIYTFRRDLLSRLSFLYGRDSNHDIKVKFFYSTPKRLNFPQMFLKSPRHALLRGSTRISLRFVKCHFKLFHLCKTLWTFLLAEFAWLRSIYCVSWKIWQIFLAQILFSIFIKLSIIYDSKHDDKISHMYFYHIHYKP